MTENYYPSLLEFSTTFRLPIRGFFKMGSLFPQILSVAETTPVVCRPASPLGCSGWPGRPKGRELSFDRMWGCSLIPLDRQDWKFNSRPSLRQMIQQRLPMNKPWALRQPHHSSLQRQRFLEVLFGSVGRPQYPPPFPTLM